MLGSGQQQLLFRAASGPPAGVQGTVQKIVYKGGMDAVPVSGEEPEPNFCEHTDTCYAAKIRRRAHSEVFLDGCQFKPALGLPLQFRQQGGQFAGNAVELFPGQPGVGQAGLEFGFP